MARGSTVGRIPTRATASIRYDRGLTREQKIRACAIPGALIVAWLFHAWPTGHWLQRTFLSMIVHELGHAVTAWWCGFAAIPGLWKTLIPETRSAIWIAVTAVCAGLAWLGWSRQRWWLIVLALALGALQLVAHDLDPDVAHMWITFGGDGGAMVLGAALMASFFIPKLAEHGLRWGLLSIGAAAFIDTFATWWSARSDPDVIPFGEIEGVGLSDPSKLQEVYSWSTNQIVHRYVALGAIVLGVLLAITVWQTFWHERAE
jgi:hypothetical protein